jgi:galactose mutarotase-like enzyme
VIEEGDVELADAHWRLTLAPQRGFLIREACDARSGAQMLWRQVAPAPPPPSRELPPPGPESIETFWDIFAGGWFPMFPSAGFTGELDGAPTLFHGELNRLPWEVVGRGPSWIEARVDTVRAPFAVERRVALEAGELRIETTFANTGAAAVSFTYGEHPCFPYATFAGGRMLLAAREAWVPHPSFDPERAQLRPGERFAWPHAPSRDGGTLDLSLLPADADGRHDHACALLAEPRVRIEAPRFGRALELEVDLAVTPYALIWQDFGERGAFAVEPGTAPDRGVREAIAAGAVGRLAPGERLRNAFALRWSDLGR